MRSREDIQSLIQRSGEVVERWRPWGYESPSDQTPLLRKSRPSGYSNWFVVKRGKTIWWVYSDSSDGGSWSSQGIKITGYKIRYEETVAEDIYLLAYQEMIT